MGGTVGFRFRRSLSIFPGLRINLSGSGVSTSIGGRGATLNFSKRGVRGTVGLPGTGLSYSENLSALARGETAASPQSPLKSGSGGGVMLAVIAVVVMVIGGSLSRSPTAPTEPAENAVPLISTTTATAVTITGSRLNCRTEANASGRVVRQLEKGELVTVLSRQPGWLKIQSPLSVCWVSAEYTRAQ